VYAAGGGVVVAVFDEGADDREVDLARFQNDKLADYGNYIIIDHGGGEFALYGHLRHGSARVKTGMLVDRGQPLAAIGASGSSLMPHLHFQLQTAPSTAAEGLPSYFDHFRRVTGNRSRDISHGQIDSGDIVEDALRQK
jgi:murein DD-endopeptidase MepM/ murein hydrolase activator NlpD